MLDFVIVQGTTPTHAFSIPFDAAEVKAVRFVYSQDGEVVCIKTGDAVLLSAGEAATTLTQEDTYSFNPDLTVKLMLRVLMQNGDAFASDPILLVCRACDCKEVLA